MPHAKSKREDCPTVEFAVANVFIITSQYLYTCVYVASILDMLICACALCIYTQTYKNNWPRIRRASARVWTSVRGPEGLWRQCPRTVRGHCRCAGLFTAAYHRDVGSADWVKINVDLIASASVDVATA